MSNYEYSQIWNFQILHVSHKITQKHRNSREYQGLICAQETGDKFKKNKRLRRVDHYFKTGKLSSELIKSEK